MTAYGPEFYDALVMNPHTPYLGAVEDSPYQPMYAAAAALVPAGETVVELGCGTGRLARMLIDKGCQYTGLDFAPKLIREARRYNGRTGEFLVADLRTDPIPVADCYVATEVLEHLDDDLGLIDRLLPGSTVVLTVPSFASESHVRHFPRHEDARERYGSVLGINHLEFVPIGDKRAYFHVIRGLR